MLTEPQVEATGRSCEQRVSLVDRVTLPEPRWPRVLSSVTSSLFPDSEERPAADRAQLKGLVQDGSQNTQRCPVISKRKKMCFFFLSMCVTVLPGHRPPSSKDLERFPTFLSEFGRIWGLRGPLDWAPLRAHLHSFLDSQVPFPPVPPPVPISKSCVECVQGHTHTHTQSPHPSKAFASCFLPCSETGCLTKYGTLNSLFPASQVGWPCPQGLCLPITGMTGMHSHSLLFTWVLIKFRCLGLNRKYFIGQTAFPVPSAYFWED